MQRMDHSGYKKVCFQFTCRDGPLVVDADPLKDLFPPISPVAVLLSDRWPAAAAPTIVSNCNADPIARIPSDLFWTRCSHGTSLLQRSPRNCGNAGTSLCRRATFCFWQARMLDDSRPTCSPSQRTRSLTSVTTSQKAGTRRIDLLAHVSRSRSVLTRPTFPAVPWPIRTHRHGVATK